MKLNLLIYKLENKIRKIAIERLMGIITVCMGIVFAADLILDLTLGSSGISINSYLYFDRDLIFQGQVWRVISFIIAYPISGKPLLVALTLYFYWWTGTAVENYWGKARFNLYYFFGLIATIIAGFIAGGITNTYLNLSLFLAFAVTFSEQTVLLFFCLPIKVKWIGLAEGALLIYYLIVGSWYTKAAVIAVIVTFAIFCGYDLINLIKRAIEDYKYRKNNGGGNYY